MKVLSLLPRSRFTESGMTLPETLSLHFLPPNGSHVLIAAAESAGASAPAVPAVCGRLLPRTDVVHPLHPDHGRGL